MTTAEMRKKLRDYCHEQGICSGCKLEDPVCRCGCGVSFQTKYENGKYAMTAGEIFAAYRIVFPPEAGTPTEEAPTVKPPKKDVIEHPEHYCYSKYEPKDVIRAWGLNFNLGSSVKYIARAGRKDDILQDLKKARQFLTFEIEALEEELNV